MLKTLAVIAVVVAVIVAGILIYATTKPDSVRGWDSAPPAD